MSGPRSLHGAAPHPQDVRDAAADYAEQLARSLELLDADLTANVRDAARKSTREAAAMVLRYSESDGARDMARNAFRRLAHDRISAEIERVADELREAGAYVSSGAVYDVVRRRTVAASAQSIKDAEQGRIRIRGGRRA